MLRLFLLISCLIAFTEFAVCQSGKSNFYPEGYGMLYKRKNVNFVSINTENTVKPFFIELNRQFGSPIIADEYTIYKYTNRRLSDKPIVVRISQILQVDLDNKRSNTLFIYVETQDYVDLLKPERSSSKELKAYFNNLYQKKVVNAPLDNFNE